jgi:hypothetical protein
MRDPLKSDVAGRKPDISNTVTLDILAYTVPESR